MADYAFGQCALRPNISARGEPRAFPFSRTSRGAAARVTFHTRAIPHQREVAALAAHLAFVALGLCFRPAFGFSRCDSLRRSGLAPLQRFQLLRRREVVLALML